jgi:chromosome segregation ATPase
MSYFISGAILIGSAYQANEARKARISAENAQKKALQQQADDAAAFREKLTEQTGVYSRQAGALEEQARIAKGQLETAQSQLSQNVKEYETGLSQYEQSRLEMEKKAKETQAQIDEERRKAAEQQATQMRARIRGGRRALLSQERLTPELGITTDTLGSGMGMM